MRYAAPRRAAQPADSLAADLERYLAEAQARGVQESTLRLYRHDLSEFLAFLRSERVTALWMLDQVVLRRWFSALRRQGLGSGSIARRVREARAFVAFALAGQPNPFARLRAPRTGTAERRILGREQVDRLLAPAGDTPVDVRDRAVLAVLYATGLRVSDLVALDVRQLDLPGAQIHYWDRTGRARVAFLGRSAAVLAEYVERARPLLLRGAPERALFVSREARRISPRAVEHLVKRRARAAGFSATPRDLRATCAAHLREGGATAIAVRALLGTSLTVKPRRKAAE